MVSAVILSYNRSDEVSITLGKLKEVQSVLPFPLQIIVVDNACTDNTAEQVLQLHPDVDLVRIETNRGIAGWNEGFKIAKYPYLLVLDDDSHIESGLVEAIAYLEQTPEVGILALNVTTGMYLSKDFGWQDIEETAFFIGCGAIIRNEVYKKIGGFADWLVVYSHEWEFCLRAFDAGYKSVYFENSNIIHRSSAANRSTKRLRVFCARNEMAIIYKYFGSKKWLYFSRICLNHLKFLRIGAFRHTWYSFVGVVEFLKMRTQLQQTTVSQEAQDFFIKHNENTKPVFGNIIKRIKRIK